MSVGRASMPFVCSGIDEYLKRLGRYIGFRYVEVPDPRIPKNADIRKQKELEGEMLLQKLTPSDTVVLLDEKGREFTSVEFASYMQKQMASGRKRIVFIVGGPYGFSNQVYDRADGKISLSRMTFNHEMVRLFFIEQIYRAMTILRNEPYHHE